MEAATAASHLAGAAPTGRPRSGEEGGTSLSGAALTALLQRLETSETGLTAAQAAERIKKFGLNDPAPVRATTAFTEVLRFCANPLVIILLLASVVSAVVGDIIDAVIIAAIMLLSGAVNFFQTYRSQRAVLRLRAQVAPTATALRDGKWTEVPRSAVVPGDLIRLSAGDLVPADSHMIWSRNFHLQEAALTGESMPVEKSPAETGSPESSIQSSNMIFLGTSVVSGMATAVVITTGRATAFGDIATRLTVRAPETEFDRGSKRFGLLIMETVFFLVLFILLVNLAMHRNALESLLFAVALAVGLTPEFLPMITTVTLSVGAVKMARKNVIVKHLAAIQNLGSIDVLCTDKTGTLTAGEMTVDRSLDPFGQAADRAIFLAYLNSYFETGIRSPLDSAILKQPQAHVDAYHKTDEIPFDFDRRRLSIVVEKDDKALLISKGAPEGVLQVCSEYEIQGVRHPLDDAQRKHCDENYQDLSAKGFRVLAVAYRPLDRAAGLTAADERDLILVGFLTFADPPLKGAAESIAAMRRDGVQVKILTGDNELVTKYICAQVGIDSKEVVVGDDIARMDDSALAHVAEESHVFARVSPAQKNRIILALKHRNHVVGFLGDGINDAPSLHTADVGISVAGAVDVAKDSADIILLEPGFEVLHTAIVEGRKAFANVLKYLLMGTSSNFGNMFSMAGASLFLPFLPMLPTQILLNNFLYDLSQVTIPTDNVDPAYTRRPHRWDISIIRDFMILIGPISSIYDFLTFFVLLKVFHASETLFHTGWFVESLATQTLVIFVIRTAGRPWRDRPSVALTASALIIVAIGILLPFSPLGGYFGFTPLPPDFLLFLVVATATYLALVEVAKRRLMRRLVD
ncbi:magnesium-translocating P-type ATPase [Candidatus Binatus sp.]|uniref:magnesium-translocating P-type ATPase n=1 Tax=Candidatus Binatus sp. TaxID=2811406 RepID=UPI002FDB3047